MRRTLKRVTYYGIKSKGIRYCNPMIHTVTDNTFDRLGTYSIGDRF